MLEVFIPIVRVLGAPLLVAFLSAAAAVGRFCWRVTDALPDHRLVDGASSWHGCIPPEARRVEFVAPLVLGEFVLSKSPDADPLNVRR